MKMKEWMACYDLEDVHFFFAAFFAPFFAAFFTTFFATFLAPAFSENDRTQIFRTY